MLVRADGLGCCLETSIALGAHDPGLSTRALFLQHPRQRHLLAVRLAAGESRPDDGVILRERPPPALSVSLATPIAADRAGIRCARRISTLARPILVDACAQRRASRRSLGRRISR